MACGKYPENDESFIENTKKETEQAALMLRNHPSLMWWSGDNENAVWGSDEKEDYNGRTVTHKSIIPVLKRIDPRRRFLLSSPYGGKFFASKTVGTTHNTQYLDYIWDYIDKTDMKDYKEVLKTYTARFIAEEPAFGAATLPSLKKFMDEKDIYDETDMWLYHTKGSPSMKKELFEYAQMFAAKVLGDFENGEDRFFKFKYLHFEWMRISFENARRNKGFCNGLIYWMFNDCWPAAISWSLLDYFALPKPAYYCFKRCAKKVVASITEDKGNYKIYLSNDTFETKDINLTLALVSEKNIDPICCKKITIPPNCSFTVDTLKVPDLENEAVIVCDITGNGVSDRAFYKKGNLPLHKTDSVKILERNENSIKVYSESYVHAVELEGEYIFEDNYFSLLPGETKEISLKKVNEKAELSVVGFTL
jgi:beta-mannosidase